MEFNRFTVDNKYKIKLNIQRYNPDENRSWTQQYELEAGRILRFVDLFRKINDELDSTLAWNSSCEHGQCGTCAVNINGQPLLACELLVESAVAQFKTTTFTIKPLNIAPVVRDLIVDIEKAYERVESVKPYLIQPAEPTAEGEVSHIKPEVLEFYVNATRCINCFCCASACISSRSTFLGPNAMLASIVRLMDARETNKQERCDLLYSAQGVYRCHSSMACSFVCPKEIDVGHFIALAKAGKFSPY